ncbi:MAG: type II toxin-antitoxin system VapB family antitoxin [Spirochaetaceae bacterium]|jgi:Arc/MetJ family transcription regulator|nr:type II toxin-antitoxin system VapB family antitoxin [Spirochaetaceae bacterium]
MTQIAVDDRLITKARSLIDGLTDEEIVNAALDGWVVRKENRKEIDTLFKECRGALTWESEITPVQVSSAAG